MNCRLPIIGLLTLLLAVDSSRAAAPNVVIILADDLGYGDVGCYGATKVRTPNIDRLAAEGRRFTDAHSASAVCTPSRYALLTGEYPVRHGGLWAPVFLRSPLVVDPEKLTISDIMKEDGYATACIGKWHLGFGSEAPTDWNAPLVPGPLELGFDHYFGVPVVNSHPPFVWVEDRRVVGLTKEDPFVYGHRASTQAYDEKMDLGAIGGAEAAHKLYVDEKVGTTLAKKAVGWIGEHSDDPFFLYLATTNIHHPFTPAPRFRGTSDAGRYGDFVHELDWIVGEVMDALERAGVADNTLVVFTSDNGGMLNRGGQAAWRLGHHLNGKLLGFKFDAWEGGHRVPFIVRWPEKIASGGDSDALVSHVDLAATLAALTGFRLPSAAQGDGVNLLPAPSAAQGDGVNLLPAFTGQEDEGGRDELVIAPFRRSHLALRSGDWIYIGARGGGGFNGTRIGEHGLGGPPAFKLTGRKNSDIAGGKLKQDAPAAQLYHLAKDPSQEVNVIRDHPEVAARMKSRLAEIISSPRQ